jgi:hypothetical protein
MEMLSTDKHASLFYWSVNDGEKQVLNNETNSIKHFIAINDVNNKLA